MRTVKRRNYELNTIYPQMAKEMADLQQKIKDFHLGKWGSELSEKQRILKAKELNLQAKVLDEEMFYLGKTKQLTAHRG